MVQKIGPEEQNVILKFGGGLHTRASPDEIDGREAASGQNFLIDIQNRNLRNRQPFDLIGTAPNAQPIMGGATLLTTAGVVTTIFQAGTTVYQWTPPATFTSVGTAPSSSCKYRGDWRTHVWNLSDVVLVTDLALLDTVRYWDGANFTEIVFTDQSSNPFGSFYAKYANVIDERAIFANVKAGTSTPHMIVGSKTSNYNEISIVNAPSSSIGTDDPYYLLAPDLKPINGFIGTYQGSMISTERGMIFALTGESSQDFSFTPFYANSSAAGAESLTEIGNDFMYGRPGRLESVRDTNTYGNSQSADLTAIIADQVQTYNGWTNVFNSRLRKAYCFPKGVSQCWVLDAAIRDGGQISPWMLWTTSHPMAFLPTYVASHLDPTDGLEYVFMGDSSGNIYRMEGTGANGDGGTSPIDTKFLSKLIPSRLDSKMYDVEGYIKYQQNLAATVTLTFQYQGENIFSNSITTALSAATATSYYSAGAYYSGAYYYGSFSGRMTRNKFTMPGHANEFQVLVEVVGNNGFSINEIGIRFRAASQ